MIDMNPVLLMTLCIFATSLPAQVVDYPILAIKEVRIDDNHRAKWAEVMDPVHHEVSDLVIIQSDGTEEVLVSGGGTDAILDPKTLDGVNVYYARIYDTKTKNRRRRHVGGGMPIGGSDIYSINVTTKVVTKWTDQTDVPFEEFADWGDDTHFGYGVFNLGPQPLPDGRLVYTSSRRRLSPTKTYTAPCMQLHVRHTDGRIECVGPMHQGSSLHPELLRDGRIAYSSYESMGLRDKRLWSLWHMHPDGTNWSVLVSSYGKGKTGGHPSSFHFHTQRTDGEITCIEYYNSNNNGFGTLRGLDDFPSFTDPGSPTSIPSGYTTDGKTRYSKHLFTSSGFRSVTPWSHQRDHAATPKTSVPEGLKFETIDGDYLGKVTHPSAAPGNAILMTFSDGPSSDKERPTRFPVVHGEIRVLKKKTADHPDDLILVRKEEGFSYTQPRALVSFKEIYGTDPIALPDKVDHSKSYGVFGSADAFIGQWKFGLDSGSTGAAETLLILGAEPNIAKITGRDNRGRGGSSGLTGWSNGISERLRILGEYRFDEADRPAEDRSFRVKVPADTPFTVGIRGTDGRFLTCGQSWKQVRPGYQEYKCGGCHNHAGEEISIEGKYAFEDNYILKDFTGKWRIPEFNKDIMPIFEAHCMECHSEDAEGGQVAELTLDALIAKSRLVLPLRAGLSPLSHRIRGEHGLDQMPLNADPLSEEEIKIIDEWIDLGALVDGGDGAAFDVFSQVVNPNPVDEKLPLNGGGGNSDIEELEKKIIEIE